MLNLSVTPTLADVPLDVDLAKRLERATSKVERDIEERDRLILLAYARGASLRDIADVTGLTHVGVKKLIDRVQPDYVILDDDGNPLAIIEAKAIGRTNLTLDQLRLHLRRGPTEPPGPVPQHLQPRPTAQRDREPATDLPGTRARPAAHS